MNKSLLGNSLSVYISLNLASYLAERLHSINSSGRREGWREGQRKVSMKKEEENFHASAYVIERKQDAKFKN